MTDKLWQRRDTWVGTQVEDEMVMINIDAGNYVSLNGTATAVWNALEAPATVDGIVGGLIADYAVDAATCRASVERVLGELQAMQLADPL